MERDEGGLLLHFLSDELGRVPHDELGVGRWNLLVMLLHFAERFYLRRQEKKHIIYGKTLAIITLEAVIAQAFRHSFEKQSATFMFGAKTSHLSLQ